MDNDARVLLDWLDKNETRFAEMAMEIWRNPETAFCEHVSSKLQADFLVVGCRP